MEQFIEYSKMSKKQQKEYNKKKRVLITMNTGTRVHEDMRHIKRSKAKAQLQKESSSYY